ncbi:type II secretion system F family protein [Agromyces sp. SYSU T00266]|uniref:type II secretion system F family protein n=1 Tax=Agromyces zhanjiangensis TaxID=3158562 RepID=UPI003398CAD8
MLTFRKPWLVAHVVARERTDESVGPDRVAAIAERVAALLSAGLAPATAWAAIDVSTTDGHEARRRDPAGAADAVLVARAARAAADGRSVAEAIGTAGSATDGAAPAWAVLAAAWAVADASGAPLARCLAMIAASLRDEAQLRREAAALLAGPAASARLVASLPLVSIAFGALLGFDTLGVLLGGPIGFACLALGSALLWGGARWNRALIRRAQVAQPAAGLEFELLAMALASGASVARAERIVHDATAQHLPGAATKGTAAPVVALAERAGAPVADLLRAEAARLRGSARADGAARAASLGVRLMLPLGCCVLPAFVLLGVAPLMFSVVSGTLGGAA